MPPSPAPLTPDDKFLQEQAFETAQTLRKLPESERDNYQEIIQEIADREGIQGERLRKFQEQIRQQLHELQTKARSEKEARALKEFEGRILLETNKYFPAGLPRGFKVEVDAWKGPFKRFRTVSINAENLDDAVTELATVETEIAENDEEIGNLKAALMDEKEVKKLVKSMRAAARETSGIFSRSYLMADLAVSRQQKMAKSRFSKNVKVLEKKSKNLKEQRNSLKKALREIEGKQQKFRKIFQMSFGKRVKRLLDNKDKPSYETEVGKLREEVRKFGKDAGYVYFEFYLNEALNIKPKVLLTEAELNGKIELAYEYPKNDAERKTETDAVDAWWKDAFGAPAQGDTIKNIIPALRQEAPAILGKIVKKDMNKEVQAVLKFFFTGKYNTPDGRIQKLPLHRRKTLDEKTVVDMLKKAHEYAKIAEDDMKKLQEAFFEFCNLYDNLTPDQFEQVLRYPTRLPDVSDTEQDFRNYAKDKFTAQDILNHPNIAPETKMAIEQEGDKILLGNFHQLNRQHIEVYARLESTVPDLEVQIQDLSTNFQDIIRALNLPSILVSQSPAWIRRSVAQEAYLRERQHQSPETILNDQTILTKIVLERLADDLYRLYNLIPAAKSKIETTISTLPTMEADEARKLLQLPAEQDDTLAPDKLLALGNLITQVPRPPAPTPTPPASTPPAPSSAGSSASGSAMPPSTPTSTP